MFKPSSRLQTIYRTYNRKYFDGELPDIEVGLNDQLVGMYATLAVNVWTSEEDGLEHTVLQIHIDPNRHNGAEQLRMTLLHEMCHVKLLPMRHHGKRFESEMQMLAIKGAFKGLW